MGRSVNKVTLIGTLGRDPEVRYLPNGNAVANLSLATDESYNDKSTGQKVEQTEWHRLTVYGRLAEICQQYLKKGSRAYFEGRLRTREWEKDGVKRYTTEIICNDMMMLDSREGGMGSGAPMGGQQPTSPAQVANNMGMGLYDIAKHANFPGFHSMPSDHLACNKAVFDAMPEHHQRIMKVAMESLALRTALTFEKANAEAVAQLRADGVNIYTWSDEDLQSFRDAAQATWPEFATTPEAKALVESHMTYLTQLGLVSE